MKFNLLNISLEFKRLDFIKSIHVSKKNTKWVLISYIYYPNSKPVFHTNFYESNFIIEWFKQNGYNIDYIRLDRYPTAVDFSKYNVVFGSGAIVELFIKSAYTNTCQLIMYCPGFNPHESNFLTARLLKEEEFKNHRGLFIKYHLRNTDNLLMQFELAKAILVFGDGTTIESYKNYSEKVFSISPFFIPSVKINTEIYKKENQIKFTWFGSNGAVHKGLHFLLSIFNEFPKNSLIIHGLNKAEKQILNYFNLGKNINDNGYINPSIKYLGEDIHYTILPSASEGGSPSILTSCLYFNALPIITKSCGLDKIEKKSIIIRDLNREGVRNAILMALDVSWDDYNKRLNEIKNIIIKEYNYENYKRDISYALNKVLNENL